MDPFSIAALISGIGGVASSIFGGISQSNQAQQQNALTQQQIDDAKLGATDALGTRTYFKPGVGWVTENGPIPQQLQNWYYSQVVPEQQAQYLRNAERSRAEDDTANSLLDEFRRIQRDNPNDIENLLFSAASRGVGKQTSDALQTAMTQALRSGTSNAGKIAAAITKQGQETLADRAIQSKLQALDYVDSKYNSNRNAQSALYNAFASNARSPLSSAAQPATSSTSAVVGSQPTGQQIAADNGLANALGGVSSSLGGILNAYGTQQQNNQTNQLLQQFMSGYGSNGATNIFGSSSDRSRTGSSAF